MPKNSRFENGLQREYGVQPPGQGLDFIAKVLVAIAVVCAVLLLVAAFNQPPTQGTY